MQNSPLKNMLLVTDLWKSLLLNIIENMHDIGNGLIKETIQRYIITYNNSSIVGIRICSVICLACLCREVPGLCWWQHADTQR